MRVKIKKGEGKKKKEKYSHRFRRVLKRIAIGESGRGRGEGGMITEILLSSLCVFVCERER